MFTGFLKIPTRLCVVTHGYIYILYMIRIVTFIKKLANNLIKKTEGIMTTVMYRKTNRW